MTTKNTSNIERTLLLTLGPLMLLAPLSVDMYVPFMPNLSEGFHTTPALIQMTITLPMLMMAIGQVFWGVLCDYVGRLKALYTTLTLFILSSISCCFFLKISPFIVARAFQAFAVCGGQVMTLSIVRDLTEGRQTQRLFSRLLGVSGTAPIFAPFLGTLMFDVTGSWRTIFLFLAAYSVICVTMLSFLPHQTLKDAHARHEKPPFSLQTLINDIRSVLSRRNFQCWSPVPMLVMIGLFLFVAMSTHYLQVYQGFSKKGYALVLALNALLFFSTSFVAPHLNTIFGEKRSIQIGLIGIMLAQLAQAVFWALRGQSVVFFVISIFLSSSCYGLINGAAVRLALEGFGSITGLATSLLGFFQFAAASFITSLVVQPPLHSPLGIMLALFFGAMFTLMHVSILSERETVLEESDVNEAQASS